MYGILNDQGGLLARFTAPLTVRSNQPVFVADALSLKRSISKSTAQRWEIETNVEPLSVSAQDLMVNLVTKGFSESVLIRVPQNYGAVKALTANNTTVTVSGSVNSSQVIVASSIGLIPSGTFLKFGNYNKMYMATSSLQNNGILNIFPALRSAVAAGTTLYFRDDVLINFLYDTDTVIGMSYEDGILMNPGTLKLIEKL
jgi:hypothetical protein